MVYGAGDSATGLRIAKAHWIYAVFVYLLGLLGLFGISFHPFRAAKTLLAVSRLVTYTRANFRMLTIRAEQMKAFEAITGRVFIENMMAHLRAHFPSETRGIDVKGLRERIQRELVSAARFGIVAENDVSLFLNLSMLFGEGFIDAPERVWARDYLTDREVPDAGIRMNRLYDGAIARLEIEENNRRLREGRET
jgi:hypothetical protein